MRIVLLSILILGCSSSESTPVVVDSGVIVEDSVAVDTAPEDSGVAHPTPDEISFKAVNPLPAGEQLLFNDWNASPNGVFSMKPDGSSVVEIFRGYRVWAMGVSHAADKIAFSCGDPKQKERYGLEIGDAIQHTWMYDVATQKITPVSRGNLNDECHAFSPDDKTLFVCRRYDFAFDGENVTNKGWRIASIDVASNTPTFLSPDVPREFHLGPSPTPDGKELWYSITKLEPPSQKFRIVKTALPAGGASSDIRADAARPVLSPDGKKYVYADTLQKSALFVADVGAANGTRVANGGTEIRWSPDGTKIAFLTYDAAANCQHIETAKIDGSELDKPTRLLDCAMTKQFITELAWVTKK
jgi:hypothetical protein